MEKKIQDFIENLKSRTMDTENMRKAILRIKRNLDDLLDCCEDEIKDGEITKEQLVQEFLEEYRNEIKETPNYQSRLTYLLSQYESCKRILKSDKKDKGAFQGFINEAKKREASNPKEELYNSINMKEQIITNIRYAMRDIQFERKMKKQPVNSAISNEELLKKIHEIKNRLAEELKDKMIPSIQKRVYFLDEYGYLDEYIKINNDALENLGLAEISQERRNPLPDVEYDMEGNIRNTEEFEDMGVIDVFEKCNLKKYSPEELLILELFWKSQYFTERLEISEAFAAIDFLDLWPMMMNEDESAIDKIPDEKLATAIKRDLALTYLMKNKKAITPELEEKYVGFLKQNGIVPKNTTIEDVEKQTAELQIAFDLASELALGECVIIDKLRNKEIEVKNWGLVDKSNFKDIDPINEKVIIAAEMPTFRGPLLFSLDEDSVKDFFEKKGTASKGEKLKLPRYKGNIDSEYSKAMSMLFLPTSVYFKKYITEKYSENPSSPLLSQLAINFADAKKIKKGTESKKTEENVR